MKTFSQKHLLGIQDIDYEDINLIFEVANNFKEVLNRPIKKVPSLRDLTIANLFFENSTRTRISFELAEKRLSADVINFSTGASSVKKGETFLDTVKNILAMKVDIIVLRHHLSGACHFLSQHVESSIINAGDGIHEHPSQALLDAYSIHEKFGTIENLKVAIIGDISHSRVARSNIILLKKMGAEVMVCGPATLIPKYIEDLNVKATYNLKKALAWCDVANVLRIQLERQGQTHALIPSLWEYHLYYGLTENLINTLNKEITILHPGPINRGVELSGAITDLHHTFILNQVENGVAIRMAILYLLASLK